MRLYFITLHSVNVLLRRWNRSAPAGFLNSPFREVQHEDFSEIEIEFSMFSLLFEGSFGDLVAPTYGCRLRELLSRGNVANIRKYLLFFSRAVHARQTAESGMRMCFTQTNPNGNID